MNQSDAIVQYFTDNQVSRGRVDRIHQHCWICPDCFNALLEDEEQATQADFGSLRVEIDPAKCSIKHLIDGHEYQDV